LSEAKGMTIIMKKKLIITAVSSLLILALTGTVLFAAPRLSKEKKGFYDNKRIEFNNENGAITKEMSEVAKMPSGAERQQKEKELQEKLQKFKAESSKTMEEMKQDGYVSDEDIIDSNSKLIKRLDGLRKLTEWDIRGYQDKELIDFETKQLNKIKKLLEKVKQSDESKFGELFEEYKQMVKSFQEERPLFEEQYRKKHGR
jgi:hypothetical protein